MLLQRCVWRALPRVAARTHCSFIMSSFYSNIPDFSVLSILRKGADWTREQKTSMLWEPPCCLNQWWFMMCTSLHGDLWPQWRNWGPANKVSLVTSIKTITFHLNPHARSIVYVLQTELKCPNWLKTFSCALNVNPRHFCFSTLGAWALE